MSGGGYARVSTKWCSKHRPPPATPRDRIRKWRGKSYRVKVVPPCSCPSVQIQCPPGTYSEGICW